MIDTVSPVVVPIKPVIDLGFVFRPGQDVLVKKIGTVGKVITCNVSLKLIAEYQVVWWIHDQRRIEWLFDFELEEAK
jgi:hypothetical protein